MLIDIKIHERTFQMFYCNINYYYSTPPYEANQNFILNYLYSMNYYYLLSETKVQTLYYLITMKFSN